MWNVRSRMLFWHKIMFGSFLFGGNLKTFGILLKYWIVECSLLCGFEDGGYTM